jgi:hypothetical protein
VHLLMNIEPNILGIIHEVLLSVGDDANDQNLVPRETSDEKTGPLLLPASQ